MAGLGWSSRPEESHLGGGKAAGEGAVCRYSVRVQESQYREQAGAGQSRVVEKTD